AVDTSGNTYVTGSTASSNFSTTAGAYQTTNNGYDNVFVTKVASNGTSLVYSTFLGGNFYEFGQGIAIDINGNAYVTGQTYSANFPTTAGAYQTSNIGSSDVFVTKVASNGVSLLSSTYLGGSNDDIGLGIAVDTSGNAYVTGYTVSTNYPTTAGAYKTTNNGSFDIFLTKVTTNGASLLYSTYLGGSA